MHSIKRKVDDKQEQNLLCCKINHACMPPPNRQFKPYLAHHSQPSQPTKTTPVQFRSQQSTNSLIISPFYLAPTTQIKIFWCHLHQSTASQEQMANDSPDKKETYIVPTIQLHHLYNNHIHYNLATKARINQLARKKFFIYSLLAISFQHQLVLQHWH